MRVSKRHFGMAIEIEPSSELLVLLRLRMLTALESSLSVSERRLEMIALGETESCEAFTESWISSTLHREFFAFVTFLLRGRDEEPLDFVDLGLGLDLDLSLDMTFVFIFGFVFIFCVSFD